MEFSEFFKNVVHFYKNDFFTDVEISVFNTSSQEISSVCHCHKLVLASAIPQLKNILFSNEDSQIILQDIDSTEVKNEIEKLYQSLLQENMGNYDSSKLCQIFSMKQEKIMEFSDLQKELLETRMEIENLDDIGTKYLTVHIEDLTHLKPDGDFYIVSQKNGDNLAAKVSKSGLSLLEIMSRLFQVPLKSILESDYQSFYNQNGVQEELNLLPYKNVENVKLETKIYFENVTNTKDCLWMTLPSNVENELVFQIVDFEDIEDQMFDLVQVSNDNKMSSVFKKEEIMALNDQEKCDFILRELTKILNLSSRQELYFEPVLKALFETHYIKLYRQEALRIFHPESQVSSKKTKAKIISKNITKVAIIDLKCPHEGCEKTFKKKAGYRKHVNYFHLKEGSGVPCDQCGIIYQNFFYLRIHKRQAHEHVTCKECDEIFIGENELGRHRRKVHLTGNEHICEVCGQGFKMRFYMKRHKRYKRDFF